MSPHSLTVQVYTRPTHNAQQNPPVLDVEVTQQQWCYSLLSEAGVMVSGHGSDDGRHQQTPSTSPRQGTATSSSNQGFHSRSSSSSPPPLERWERRMMDAKKSHRPRLRNWGRDRFGVEGSRAAAAFEALRDERGNMQGIARETVEDLPPELFWRHYEQRRLPVIVSGIPVTEGWKAGDRWSLEQLNRR